MSELLHDYENEVAELSPSERQFQEAFLSLGIDEWLMEEEGNFGIMTMNNGDRYVLSRLDTSPKVQKP